MFYRPVLLRPLMVSAAALLVASTLAGCAGSTKTAKTDTPPQLSKSELKMQEKQAKDLINQDPVAAAAYWGSLYDNDNSNADAVVNYSTALRQMGSLDRAMEVMSTASRQNASDSRIMAEYGKVLIASGKAADAAPVLDRATQLDPKNWSAFAAAGVAQDQLGDPEAAKARYESALALKSDNASTLNNYALSRALAGDLTKAESLLRDAVKIPNSGPKIRQNLALVLALQGKFPEAEKLANGDLLPADAKNNMDYIRALIGQNAPGGAAAAKGNAG